MKLILIAGFLAFISSVNASNNPHSENQPIRESAQDDKGANVMQTPSGLSYQDLKVGTGPLPKPGQTVEVHYTGWLHQNNQKFDSSIDRGESFSFVLGQGQVIPGWDEGVAGMRVGGKRELIIPSDLAYGAHGVPGAIPGNATLKFEVELLNIK